MFLLYSNSIVGKCKLILNNPIYPIQDDQDVYIICGSCYIYGINLGATISDPPLLRGYVEDVVAADEGISVLVLQLPVDVLLRLLQADIHVAIQAGQDP